MSLIILEDHDDPNIFLNIAKYLVSTGADMEDVAQNLGTAFRSVVAEGIGKDDMESHVEEFKRLTGNKLDV